MHRQFRASVVEAVKLTEEICSVGLKADDIGASAVPGQFLHIRCGDANLLRRPISISDIRDGVMTIVFQVRGEGTKWLADRRAGDVLDVLGPLGNGFDLGGKNIILVGGGIGVPPMLFSARAAAGRPWKRGPLRIQKLKPGWRVLHRVPRGRFSAGLK